MSKIKEMIKSVEEGDYAEFRKLYVPEIQKDYECKKQTVRDYICKRISLGKPTYI